MKKRVSLLILLVSCLMLFNVTVNAASATTKISGTNTVKVGNTTKIYISLNASNKIEGVDVTYKTSGNIKVTNVGIGSGLSKMGQDGSRYILYANNPLKSGSTVLVLTVKGTKEGTGTVRVSNMEATVDGTTVNGGTKSYTITVTPAKTQAQIEAEKEAQEKAEEEAKKKEEERKLAISKATTLVEAAEKSLIREDYDAALASVKALADGTEKTALLERLDEVEFKIAVKEECGKQTCECEDGGDVVVGSSRNWIILCVLLFLCLIAETIYLIYKSKKKVEYI